MNTNSKVSEMTGKNQEKSKGTEIPVKVVNSGHKPVVPEKSLDPAPDEEKSPEKAGSKDERIRDLEEQVRRLSAEFENFRRRQERKVEEIRNYAADGVIAEFLPVLDSIEQAVLSVGETDRETPLGKGLAMIGKQLQQTLTKLGVEEVPTVGVPFDTAMHQAISVEETGEHPDETVLEQYRKGYKYKDRALRPAMVKVSRLPGSISGAENNEEK